MKVKIKIEVDEVYPMFIMQDGNCPSDCYDTIVEIEEDKLKKYQKIQQDYDEMQDELGGLVGYYE